MDPRKIVVDFGPGVPCIFIMVGDVSDGNLCLMAASLTKETRVASFPAQSVAPLFCLSFCFACLLSAKPPPAKDWCAGMVYGSDCQGLLKPIQFQDPGSHCLSLTAHKMSSHYQLTCFIIVNTLKWYFKKGGGGRIKIMFLSPHFSPLCPKLLCLRFTAPSISHSATCWPCKPPLHSPFTVLCLHLLVL